jgi:hypothetical protein
MHIMQSRRHFLARVWLKAIASVLAVACAGSPTPTFAQTAPRLTPLFATVLHDVGFVETAPLYANVQGVEYVLVAAPGPDLVAVAPKTGEVVWTVRLPVPPGEDAAVRATPARARDYLVLAYGPHRGSTRVRNLVSVVNLQTGTLADDEFATLQLEAQKPATDGGVVTFHPPTARPTAALAWAGDGNSPDALLRFRYPPSHLAVSTSPVDGEQYVWVGDNHPSDDPDLAQTTLLGIRVRDGTIIAEIELAGISDSIRPLHHDGVLYVTSKARDGGAVLLEAFSIEY